MARDVGRDRPLTDAAAVLGTSQPTLSRTIARLEDELGMRVLDRTSGGVQLTPGGEMVVAAARDITSRYDELRSSLAAVADPDAGLVRLAFLDSMATSLVPQLLKRVPPARPAGTRPA
ncbi:LysR family transcriptional regulator [Aeromicrobium sp. UC242_57]|uniref:LysR family transcriptional regulator n=1 Tax=Aeromicrobium sp. UC242_57 TaxID=3374624 RepID=UPI003794C8A3